MSIGYAAELQQLNRDAHAGVLMTVGKWQGCAGPGHVPVGPIEPADGYGKEDEQVRRPLNGERADGWREVIAWLRTREHNGGAEEALGDAQDWAGWINRNSGSVRTLRVGNASALEDTMIQHPWWLGRLGDNRTPGNCAIQPGDPMAENLLLVFVFVVGLTLGRWVGWTAARGETHTRLRCSKCRAWL